MKFAERIQGPLPDETRRDRVFASAAGVGAFLTRRGGRHIAALCAILVTVLGARTALVGSPYFRLKALEANACEHVTHEEIRRYLDVYPGQSLFKIDIGEMRRRLVDHPWVADVRVRREWPDAVSIEIVERNPIATVLIADEADRERPEGRVRSHKNLYYVDDRGVVFNRVPVQEQRRFPVITGFSRQDFAGDDGVLTRERIAEAASLLRVARLDWDPDMPSISEIAFDEARGFSIMVDRARVIVGRAPFDDVFFRLETVMRHLGGHFALVGRIDLTQPDRAIVKGLREEAKT